jgi:hypothetical protein
MPPELGIYRLERQQSGLLRPVGQTYLAHAYIVTPKTTDRLCAPT